MSNEKDIWESIEDIASIERNAKNAADRRLALDWCLANPWKKADIGKLHRVDTENWHGWKMLRYGISQLTE